MRFLMHVYLPLEPFNSAVRDGTVEGTIQRIMEYIKPETAYCSEQHGQRGGTLIVNVDDPYGCAETGEALIPDLRG